MSNVKDLFLLFERPYEPIFTARGDNDDLFDVPENFTPEKYKRASAERKKQNSESTKRKISLEQIENPPDLKSLMQLSRVESFSIFIPKHQRIAENLIDIFMKPRDMKSLMSMAVFARDRVNPHLFNYALSVAMIHRDDTKKAGLPSFATHFPHEFFDSTNLQDAREEASLMTSESRQPIVIKIDNTASDFDEEHRLWYFREDIGVNLHHWHWHLVYPFNLQQGETSDAVEKDRRGELFYYMHEQILARYNMERFSNHLKRVKKFSDFRSKIEEGYFPKLDSALASRRWASRRSWTVIKDLDRKSDNVHFEISDLERWRDRLFEAAHQGFYVDSTGKQKELDDVSGIDILGNMVESSILSPNPKLYGDIHNIGHLFIAYSHDPDQRYLEPSAVMGATETAMRDPVFYRWHAFIDSIFQVHKASLKPYTTDQLIFKDIEVSNVSIFTGYIRSGSEMNVFRTFWEQSDMNLSRGLDFAPRGKIFVRVPHLQHIPFKINISINNNSVSKRIGMIRVFLGPKQDERGSEFSFDHQRLLMIEIDKFKGTLLPGENIITRSSTDSSVTIPHEGTFEDLEYNNDDYTRKFCGCGWPQHMLIPRGTSSGFKCEVFVMVSDYDEDKVGDDYENTESDCKTAASYCGLRDRKYPDRRAMGYPFDRVPRDGIDSLSNFLTTNMKTQDCTIFFEGKTFSEKVKDGTKTSID